MTGVEQLRVFENDGPVFSGEPERVRFHLFGGWARPGYSRWQWRGCDSYAGISDFRLFKEIGV